jgi:phosphonate transport system permease protein
MVLGLALAGAASFALLGLTPAGLVPNAGGLRLAGEFLGAAVHPATSYEASFVPPGTPPFWSKVLAAAWSTVQLAAAATALSLVAGILLGFAARRPEGRADRVLPRARWRLARLLAALMRSVHELIWALLFLCAFGLTPLAAVLAIAIPYSGTLAKIFSEMLEEAPADTAEVLDATGASSLKCLLVGLVPRALPDLVSYSLYRFECALRSSAVMGFLGVETLGLYIAQSFEVSHHREVWAYLYALLAIIAGFDLWSEAVRRRLPR